MATEVALCKHLAERFEAEAACLTSNRAAALSLACAGVLTQSDEFGIALQRAHFVTIETTNVGNLIALADGYVIEVGTVDACTIDEVREALSISAAGLFVDRRQSGLVDRPNFIWACRETNVPSIIEAGETTNWVAFVDGGASLIAGDLGVVVRDAQLGLIIGTAQWVDACRSVSNGLDALCAPSKADLERLGEVLQI